MYLFITSYLILYIYLPVRHSEIMVANERLDRAPKTSRDQANHFKFLHKADHWPIQGSFDDENPFLQADPNSRRSWRFTLLSADVESANRKWSRHSEFRGRNRIFYDEVDGSNC